MYLKAKVIKRLKRIESFENAGYSVEAEVEYNVQIRFRG